MITGVVNANREAVIPLKIQGPNGQELEIEAIIDTGFNSFLTLPPSIIAALGLPWLMQGRVTLGNGSEELFDIFQGTVLWDGQPLRIMVDEADTEPLVGMGLIYGYDLNIQAVDGGPVTLQRI